MPYLLASMYALTGCVQDSAGFRQPKGSRKGHHEVCDPRQAGFSELACKAKFPDAYAITYWMHSW